MKKEDINFERIRELIEIAIDSERDFNLSISADGDIEVNMEVPRKMHINSTSTTDPIIKY